MDSRRELTGRNVFSVISSSFSSGSKSYALDSSPTDDFRTRYTNRSSFTYEVKLTDGVEEKESQRKNVDSIVRPKGGFRMIYVCAMASMFSALCTGFSTMYAGPATFDMQMRKSSRIKVTDNEVSWIGSILSIGMIIAIPLSVYLADRIGRKETLIFNTIPFVISWLVIIYSPNALVIMVGRIFAGWASAVVYAVLPMYVVEIASADTRGFIGASFQACIAIGSLLVMGFGAFLNWAWLAVTGCVLVVITLIVFCPMPESPRWLVAHGMKEDAIRAIQFLHADKMDAAKECQIIEESLKTQTSSKFSIQNLKQPIIYKPTLISMGQMVFLELSGSVPVLLYSSLIFESSKSIVDPKHSTAILGAVQVISTIFNSVIMDRAGRRVLLLFSGFFMGISQATLGSYFYMSSYDSSFSSKVGWLPLASSICYVAVYSTGYGPIPWIMLSEMIPTRERAFVSGMATLIISVLSFVTAKTFEDLKNVIGFHGIFWTYAAFCFLSCVFVYFLVPETKGKQLEDIQNVFRGPRKSVAHDDILAPSADGISNPAFSERSS